jgi:hypothetical protein
MSVTADGLFFEKTHGKIVIADVDIGWAGDDCANNHDTTWGNWGFVRTGPNSILIPAKNVSGSDVIGGSSDGGSGGTVSVPLPEDSRWPAAWSDPDFMVGDRVQLRRGDFSSWITTTVTAASNPPTGWELTFADRLTDDVDISKVVLFNERRDGSKFLIRNMTCYDNRARGVLLQVGDSMIVDSKFSNMAQPAIMIHGDAGINEGTGVRNAVIKNNVFDGCDVDWHNRQACILVRAAGSGSTYTPLTNFHANLSITGNTLRSMPGFAFSLANLADSVVEDNTIENPNPAEPEIEERGKVTIDTASRLTIRNNRWVRSSHPKLFVDSEGAVSESDIIGQGGGITGLELGGNVVV